jgi:hypothetical protein
LIIWARAIVAALAANPTMFPKPVPPLAQVTADIEAFDDAHVVALSRASGKVEARDAELLPLLADLDALKQFVQSLADADPENAEAIITKAGMSVRKRRASGKVALVARAGANTGFVDVIAKAVKNAAHEWAYSLDGGQTWLGMPTSLQAKVKVGPLTPGTLAKFRHRVVTKTGPGDWDDPVSLMVVRRISRPANMLGRPQRFRIGM